MQVFESERVAAHPWAATVGHGGSLPFHIDQPRCRSVSRVRTGTELQLGCGAEEADQRVLGPAVLQLINESRSTYGLRHQDFGRYQSVPKHIEV